MIRQLDLSSNQLIGSIPDSIGNMTSLQCVVDCCFSDSVDGNVVPLGKVVCSAALAEYLLTRVDCLPVIRQLDLSSNQLVGSIPDSVGNLKALTYVCGI